MLVSYHQVDDLGLITINNPPVNALSRQVRQGVMDAVEESRTDNTKAIVILCEGRTFIAGADIREFGQPVQEPTLPQLNAVIESSVKPVVAAIHGAASRGWWNPAGAATNWGKGCPGINDEW